MKKIVSIEGGRIVFTPPSKTNPKSASRQLLDDAPQRTNQSSGNDQTVTPDQVLTILKNLSKINR